MFCTKEAKNDSEHHQEQLPSMDPVIVPEYHQLWLQSSSKYFI